MSVGKVGWYHFQIFCIFTYFLFVLLITKRKVLKYSTIIVNFSSFSSISFCFMNFEALFLFYLFIFLVINPYFIVFYFFILLTSLLEYNCFTWCVSFWCITKWISYMYTYIPISPPSCVSLPPSLSHSSRLSQSTELVSLCYVAASH